MQRRGRSLGSRMMALILADEHSRRVAETVSIGIAYRRKSRPSIRACYSIVRRDQEIEELRKRFGSSSKSEARARRQFH